MHEFIPLVSGFALGLALGLLRPSLRLPVGAALAVVLGATASLMTGELEISWAFLLIDIPLVAVAAVCGLAVARRAPSRVLGTR